MRAKNIAGGQSPSPDVVHLIKLVNTVLVVLDNVSKAVVAGDLTAAEGFEAISEILDAGKDVSLPALGSGYVGSQLPVLATLVKPTSLPVLGPEVEFSASQV